MSGDCAQNFITHTHTPFYLEHADQKFAPDRNSKIKTPTELYDAIFYLLHQNTETGTGTGHFYSSSLTTVVEGMPSCRIVTVLRQWVLTSYVFLVTSFAAILVGKRGIRSHHVKISGRSSLDEDTEEKCASQQWRTSERAYGTFLTPPHTRNTPTIQLKLPTPLTQSVNNSAQFATLVVIFYINYKIF